MSPLDYRVVECYISPKYLKYYSYSNMNNVPLETLKTAFVKNLEMIKKSDCLLSPVNHNQIDAISQALSGVVTPLQLSCAISMPYDKSNLGFKKIEPISSNDPLSTSCLQFTQGRFGWYFTYAHLGDVAFTFIIARIETAPPSIIKELGLSPADGCLYGVSAGYGTRGGVWVTLPVSVFQGKYVCNGEDFEFNYIPDPSVPWLSVCSCSFTPGTFGFNLQWTDKNNGPVGITAQLTSSKPPVYDGPKGCDPCIAGVGSLYWSYTNMSVSCSLGPSSSLVTRKGIGWIDHQWMGVGVLDNPLLTLITNTLGMFSTPIIIRWAWMTLQLPGDLQYNIINYFSDLPVIGKEYKLTATKIQGITTTYSVSGTCVIDTTESVTDPSNGVTQTFPTQFTVKLNDKSYILKAVFGQSIIYTTKGVRNWEGPADVIDEDGKMIGVGFIEGNNIISENELISIPGTIAKIDQTKFSDFRAQKVRLCTGLISLLILLGILGVLLFVIYGAGKIIIKGVEKIL